ncbi:MAG: hypothetical protein WCC95_21585 [Candidatus Sulfotelmatobacter sp.]
MATLLYDAICVKSAEILKSDREGTSSRKKLGLNQVAKLVHEVKPHFSIDKVLQYARQLADESILQASA